MSREVGSKGFVPHTDINAAMLEVGRDTCLDQGVSGANGPVHAAECLPFADRASTP